MQDALLGSTAFGESKNLRNRGDFLLIATIAVIGKNCKFGIDLNVMFYYNTNIRSHKAISDNTKLTLPCRSCKQTGDQNGTFKIISRH